MFSFHKPKIYRSNLGCCICKAKSSSSRFTDSQKYENEFERCFRIQEKRSGEICNACVLLVKRWKKLSPENRLTKHWHHVVDARAGPGTKLSGNRRIINHQSNSNGPQQSSSTKVHQKSTNNNKSEVLPLSSSQTNNQSSSSGSGGPNRTRTSSISKARAIDTNVSTFTFGEPLSSHRRNYMASESASYSAFSSLSPLSSSNHSSSGITKPQSALNSSAFESVIKRFRQRQQQQHLEQQRRQINRQQRLLERQQQSDGSVKTKNSSAAVDNKPVASSEQRGNAEGSSPETSPTKRVKRMSENFGSLASYESLKVASVLDSSIWRKEKICCGIIFRGLYNEVAIFPKLLKPCECRLRKSAGNSGGSDEIAGEPTEKPTDDRSDAQLKKDDVAPGSPQPRVAKSGSISSNTSGTGSMEQTIDDVQCKMRQVVRNQPVVKRPRSIPTKRRHHQKDADISGSSEMSNLSSKESTSADSPGSGTSSSNSSSRMILMIDSDNVISGEVDDDEDVELVLADTMESSNDASSSGESLIGLEEKNPSALAMG
jgi:hypothetical protein